MYTDTRAIGIDTKDSQLRETILRFACIDPGRLQVCEAVGPVPTHTPHNYLAWSRQSGSSGMQS